MTSYFLKLSKKRQYDAMTALRGCDVLCVSTRELKFAVTARLRHIVFGPCGDRWWGGSWERGRLTEEELESAKWDVANCPASAQHFLSHLARAVQATQSHPIWGGLGKRLYPLLEERPSRASQAS